jgi:hypothetical protein
MVLVFCHGLWVLYIFVNPSLQVKINLINLQYLNTNEPHVIKMGRADLNKNKWALQMKYLTDL